MQKQQIGLARGVAGQCCALQTVVTSAGRQWITQRAGKQLAHTFHRMLAPGHRQTALVEAAGQRLARAGLVQPGNRATHIAGQQRTLDQPLGVDHQIVLALADGGLELLPFAAAPGAQRALAPAAQRHRDHPVDGGVPARNLGKALLHHPVETDAGDGARRVGERRQAVDDIAE